MTTQTTSADVVNAFFSASGKGDLLGILNTFHPDCSITAVRKADRAGVQIYGSYQHKSGAKEFIENLGSAFDTQAFTVNHVVGQGEVAFADGNFTHRVKATGKLFTSGWALRCIIRDGKILDYYFYEDSAAYDEASR